MDGKKCQAVKSKNFLQALINSSKILPKSVKVGQYLHDLQFLPPHLLGHEQALRILYANLNHKYSLKILQTQRMQINLRLP